ncbi:MAG TPA: hypothetical protein VFM05_01780, partial [Candidatus Saccharimonadales bacterium]|nr:hypothetical protein [Candidatus Saccharimonadales bacterium]
MSNHYRAYYRPNSQYGRPKVGQYVIMKTNQTEIARFHDGNTCDDRKQAEFAALARAKSFIDEFTLKKDPLGGWKLEKP